jgi:hypothetical protein
MVGIPQSDEGFAEVGVAGGSVFKVGLLGIGY